MCRIDFIPTQTTISEGFFTTIFTTTFTMQDNFLVASTTELDQATNWFCYALDAWECLIWPQEFIFRCVKSQKRVCLHFGSPTRTVIWVALSLWVCSVQVTTKFLFIITKITILGWTDKVVHSWPSWWFDMLCFGPRVTDGRHKIIKKLAFVIHSLFFFLSTTKLYVTPQNFRSQRPIREVSSRFSLAGFIKMSRTCGSPANILRETCGSCTLTRKWYCNVWHSHYQKIYIYYLLFKMQKLRNIAIDSPVPAPSVPSTIHCMCCLAIRPATFFQLSFNPIADQAKQVIVVFEHASKVHWEATKD